MIELILDLRAAKDTKKLALVLFVLKKMVGCGAIIVLCFSTNLLFRK